MKTPKSKKFNKEKLELKNAYASKPSYWCIACGACIICSPAVAALAALAATAHE